MAALAVTNPTLLDLAKLTAPDGSIDTVVEILNQTNEVLDDMSWKEGNLPTGHRSTIRAGIPEPTWRQLYGGVQPNKSATTQVTDNCGMLEAYAEIDKALADLNGNTAAFRLSEDKAHIEGMSQKVAYTLFYGNEGTAPETFTGLAARYNSLSADNAENIIVGGSTDTDNGSIWLVVWGDDTVHGIVPKGSKAGLQTKDMGEVTIENVDGAGGRMQAYRTHYRWDVGLTVRDWRYIVRIPNIEKSALSKTYTAGAFSGGADLGDLMFQAMRRVPNLSKGRPVFYMSRDMASWLARQTAAKGSASYNTAVTANGSRKYTDSFDGIPIKRVDALAADEALVS